MEKHITWVDEKEKELEKEILAEYSKEEIWKHLQYLTKLIRRAGTEDELKAARYIKGKLDEFEVDSEIHEFEAFISLPEEASLEALSPVQKSFECLPRIFIHSTPPEGMEAEVVSLGEGSEKDYGGLDVKGKIVLITGGKQGRRDATRLALERGAAAQIHVTPGKSRAVNIGQLRTIWGSPTPETIDKLPKIPAVSVCNEDGRYLADLVKNGRVLVRLKARASRGYGKIRVPVGTVQGSKEPEKFVLLGGHYCSWFAGATDNAVSNSLMLEMARIFSKYRRYLARSVRFAWWSGHEHGTYAGSTWYADHFWDDLRDHGIAYLAMDGLGRKGSSGFEASNTEEIREFQKQVVRELFDIEVESKRVPKSGDQSFLGLGIPSFIGKTGFRDHQSSGDEEPVWYSHTSEDTLDKVDIDLIAIPFKAHTVSVLRLCNNPVLPFEFVTTANLFKNGINDLQVKGGSTVDLTTLLGYAEELKKKAGGLNEKIAKHLSTLEKKRTKTAITNKFMEINSCFMELSRMLSSVLCSKAGKYGHDPMGTKFRPVPALQLLEDLTQLDSGGDEYKALRTSLLRERNRLSDALTSANLLLNHTLEKV